MTDSNLTLIVGGGFVGLFAALHLRHQNYPDPIVLMDPQSQFVFKPLLYEFLTQEMQQEQVLPSYEELLRGSDIEFVRDKATHIDLSHRRVATAGRQTYNYQNLVLAVGSIQGYLHTEGAEENAFAFRTQADAEKLGKHLRDCLQQASQTNDPTDRQNLLTFAVVGAGPSGIEIAATLADLLPQWYAEFGGNVGDLRIVLINHGKEILGSDINSHLKDTVLEALKQRSIAVKLLLGVGVKSVTSQSLTYQAQDSDELKTLTTATTIWTAGTASNPLLKSLGLPDDRCDRHGLPLVTPTLQLLDFPEVFSAGDCATVEQKSLPAVAQVAYQQGAGIAHNLVALSNGEALEPVAVNLRGTLMKLGINNSVANIFDRVQINAQTGALIRKATYLEMLPTPLHNFKATVDWIEDSIFDRYHHPELPTKLPTSPDRDKQPAELAHVSRSRSAILWIGSGVAIAAVIIGGIFMAQRSPQWKEPSTALHNQQSTNK
jgi:NADH dehydrogenase FAD-containing subunit